MKLSLFSRGSPVAVLTALLMGGAGALPVARAQAPAQSATPATAGVGARPALGPAVDSIPPTTKGQDGPIEIYSSGKTTSDSTAQGRVATFTGNVNIQTDDASIFSDYAEYNRDRHEALLVGNVRIYRADNTIVAERTIYNFETKAIRAADFAGARGPFEFGGQSVFSPGAGLQYNLRSADFTTHDSSKPDFQLRSRRVRLYPDNRVVYIGATLYVGTTPVFYFPYYYQSLNDQSGFTVTPGYTSEYGAYLLTGVTFPVTDKITALARLDYRSSRGAAAGLSFEFDPNRTNQKTPQATGDLTPYASDDDPASAVVVTGAPATTSPHNQRNLTGGTNEDNSETGTGNARVGGLALGGKALSNRIHEEEITEFLSYFTRDDKTNLNRTSLNRLPISADRYRVQLKDTTFFGDDFFLKADVDRLSDRYLLQDFYQGEFTRNPNPDNDVSAVFYQPHFITTLLARAQVNQFFNATERLPELAFEVPRVPLWNTGINYSGENSAGYLRRSFDEASPLPDYHSFRIDTFHQFTYPKTYLGWLSVVPRLGFRATYYTRSAPDNDAAYNLQLQADDTADRLLLGLNPATLDRVTRKSARALRTTIAAFDPSGGIIRPVINTGVEASFKLSRVYQDVESRAVGLDQLQHVVQPYLNFSAVEDFGVGSRKLLQFDRRLPTTQLQPIDFPQYTSIDSIDENTVVRVGVRNRLQTKRDALTVNWLELDTFFQANIVSQTQSDPNESGTFSNVFNQLTFRPLPWVNLMVDSQLPLFNNSSGFTDVNTSLNFLPAPNVELTVSNRYLHNNPFFLNSNLFTVGGFLRINDNWALSAAERYEVADHTLESQSYTVYRDLTSFVASLAVTVRNNNGSVTNRGVNDYGFLLNFTLKGLPRVSLPVGYDVQSAGTQVTQ